MFVLGPNYIVVSNFIKIFQKAQQDGQTDRQSESVSESTGTINDGSVWLLYLHELNIFFIFIMISHSGGVSYYVTR